MDKDRIPEFGELVTLEDGTTVVGDGEHTIAELPKPTVLHD